MTPDRLAAQPRVPLVHRPTPLVPAPRWSASRGGEVEIWLKRDDATGLATGGNKARKLEFLLGEAVALGADTLVTVGALQSNHARQTAAAAAHQGLACVLVLEDRRAAAGDGYHHGGNRLADELLGAEVRVMPQGADLEAELRSVSDELRVDGRVPYLVPLGGSDGVGALGYVDAARELLDQATAMGLDIDRIVHASASGGTQGGLVAGLRLAGSGCPVTGYSAGRSAESLAAEVRRCARLALPRLGADPSLVGEEDVVVDDTHVGPGYGEPDAATWAAIADLARTEGVLADPVYTGKALAGLAADVRSGAIGPGSIVVFLHTGGVAGLFAYADEWRSHPE